MGTPFEGSDSAKWSGLFERLARLSPLCQINKELLNHLQTDSHDLKILGEEFPKWLNNRQSPAERKVRVMCFFEERPTRSLGHIVPRASAQIAGYEAVSLPDDHVGMCKFDNFEDPKYKTVLNTLKKWVEEIRAGRKGQESIAVAALPKVIPC